MGKNTPLDWPGQCNPASARMQGKTGSAVRESFASLFGVAGVLEQAMNSAHGLKAKSRSDWNRVLLT